ncbi:hypothetical protein WBG99_32335 [Streptomyces sp. TG1A-60]|uniref:hypothetical protein n=1 Tax=Streptomyces sp. TG1A-60 TaxID=3129111 RepID=UPI0030D38D64
MTPRHSSSLSSASSTAAATRHQIQPGQCSVTPAEAGLTVVSSPAPLVQVEIHRAAPVGAGQAVEVEEEA